MKTVMEHYGITGVINLNPEQEQLYVDFLMARYQAQIMGHANRQLEEGTKDFKRAAKYVQKTKDIKKLLSKAMQAQVYAVEPGYILMKPEGFDSHFKFRVQH